MNFAKILAAGLAGFLLCALFLHAPIAKANPQELASASSPIHVSIYPLPMFDAHNLTSKDLPGVRVVGLSCIAKPTAKLPDAALCYVATSPQ
jgi:hypothetical protein